MQPRVALIHEWLSTFSGSERVLEQFINLFPEADVFSLVNFLNPDQRDFLHGKTVRTTFIQHLPFARNRFRHYLPLMPLAIEQLDLSSYDLIISSSHAVAKGVITGPDQLHISYIHSPLRYAWDMQYEYLRDSNLEHGIRGWVTKAMLHYLRIWDIRSANGVDVLIANSDYINRRIQKAYRREAKVIYPPVDINSFHYHEQKEDFFLAGSRLVNYKKVDVIISAFASMPTKKLVVIGDGPEYKRLRSIATDNVSFVGYASPEKLENLLQRARAFIFAAREDFGIMPLEAQACGTPVIAFGSGGVCETIRGINCNTPTGVFFDSQTPEAIQLAVTQFENEHNHISPRMCRENAERFSTERFCKQFSDMVNLEWHNFQERKTKYSN